MPGNGAPDTSGTLDTIVEETNDQNRDKLRLMLHLKNYSALTASS